MLRPKGWERLSRGETAIARRASKNEAHRAKRVTIGLPVLDERFGPRHSALPACLSPPGEITVPCRSWSMDKACPHLQTAGLCAAYQPLALAFQCYWWPHQWRQP